MWLMAVVGVAPCQCFSPGSNQTTSPGRISSTDPPSRRAQPQPAVTISVWPSGWVCQAVRAPGSKVTRAIATRAGSGGLLSGSMRTVPVKYSSGPLPDGCEPARLISIVLFLSSAAANPGAASAARPPTAVSTRLRAWSSAPPPWLLGTEARDGGMPPLTGACPA